MSIKKQITLIENKLKQLNSDDLNFEDQIDIYQSTLGDFKKLKKEIDEKINTIEALEIE
ncbi:MAG: hypothetical protein VW397_02380 [Candidatus Margulisiibacteriota bacterium]